MTKEARKALRAAILSKLDDDMMPISIGGHEITDQYVYAGCSQWIDTGNRFSNKHVGQCAPASWVIYAYVGNFTALFACSGQVGISLHVTRWLFGVYMEYTKVVSKIYNFAVKL